MYRCLQFDWCFDLVGEVVFFGFGCCYLCFCVYYGDDFVVGQVVFVVVGGDDVVVCFVEQFGSFVYLCGVVGGDGLCVVDYYYGVFWYDDGVVGYDDE